ncbi:MAG: guanylate cyclase [Spirochaetales bacterium]|nr:guanylate cyclase [Spirochaetales bacterium]MCF7939251.1 guanylate cyclase [Spirochaetales bacterium]
MNDNNVFGELVRASSQLSAETRYTSQVSILVEQATDISRSDLAVLYAYSDSQNPGDTLRRVYQRGRFDTPEKLPRSEETVDFVEDCGQTLILHDTGRPFFSGAFLNPQMRSAIVLPLFTPTGKIGILYLNSHRPGFFTGGRFLFLDSLTSLAGGMLHNSNLYRELQRQLKYVENLERYQENIFSSMTNFLITTDEHGAIHYFNKAAVERLGLSQKDYGKPVDKIFKAHIGKEILRAVRTAEKDGKERLGLEGILKGTPGSEKIAAGDPECTSKAPEVPEKNGSGREKEIDFSLNISPLRGKRGKKEGLTLLFTDQSRERRLQKEMETVVEERRAIKNMFSRYLSEDIVQQLTDKPELVKPGGDKKIATIFFADIRGYTTFSETKEPEYIIDVLNAYFSQAVEIIIKHKGYIDKFIGDAIMAAWGVPLNSEEEDALAGVECAVELQQLIHSKKRTFFVGEASHLSVGIGMHTGSLVAGNLGSERRMDYSVIGDTVNVAARLEGVAKSGEVIITEQTREMIGDRFKLKELEPVKVKGKEKPIHIFSVLKQVS